jgi:hypothetical protein
MAIKYLTSLDLQTNQVTNVGAPTLSTDAATKGYVDSVAQGLDIKASVKAASSANVTSLSGTGGTVGGVVLSADDRVLLKDQSTASENGIYVVKSGSWVRATDADGANLTLGAFTFVEGGTNGGKGYVLSSANTWTQFSESTVLSAGTGITVSGQTISINTAWTGQTAITTLGTISTGTWNGSTIGVAHGGTGATSLTGYVKADGTNAMTASTTIPAQDVSGRKLAHTIPSGTAAGAYDISTLTLDSALRAEAIVQIRDNSNNLVYGDVTVSADKVTVTLGAQTTEAYKVSIFV